MKKTFKTHEPPLAMKFMQMYWVNPKSWRLDEFTVDETILTVKMQNGQTISSPIAELKLRMQPDKYERMEYYIEYQGNKLHFKVIDGMFDKDEWSEIDDILNTIPDKGTTKLNKFVVVLNAIVGFLKKFTE